MGLLELPISALTTILIIMLYVLVRIINTKWQAPRDSRDPPPSPTFLFLICSLLYILMVEKLINSLIVLVMIL